MSMFDESDKVMEVEAKMGMSIRNRNIIPNLKVQRQELITRVEKIDRFLNLLERNPEFVQMLDLSRELI